ncbi:MAG: hypothetical protein RL266_1877 [Bacteroidota bacterium]
MPEFTIITPVLNQVSHIETCILSVLEQNVDVQFIIMDGGSTDGTVDIIRKYEEEISFWESEKDRGQSHAINKGLELANGTFFNWLNADDLLTPNALKTVLDKADATTDVVIGKCAHVNENGKLLDVGATRVWDSVEATLGNYSMGQPSHFYRTSIVKDLGGLNEHLDYCMDMDLWFRFLTRSGQEKLAVTDSVLSQFLVHSDSKSVESKEKMRQEKYGIYRVLLSQFKQPEVLKNFLSQFPIPNVEPQSYAAKLEEDVLLAHFCWHLLVSAYEVGNLEECRAFFNIVSKENRLTESDKLKWKARLAAKQFFG